MLNAMSGTHKTDSHFQQSTSSQQGKVHQTTMKSSRRTDWEDPGCLMPEAFDPTSLFVDKCTEETDEDEDTVVMNNLDRRPTHIGKHEKIRRLSSISPEEREARDRQLIELYTRKGSQQRKPARAGFAEAGADKWSSNRSIMSASNRSVPENFYPYYDLVVTDAPNAVQRMCSEDSADCDDVILPPTYTPPKGRKSL